MPKLKTNKAAKKRFKITKKGKVLKRSTLKRHMLTDRSPKKKRQARGWSLVDKSDDKRFKKLMPYHK